LSYADLDSSLAFGRKALDLLENRRTPATPRNYQLLYGYITGHNRKLVEAVNAALAEGELTEDRARQIHEQHFGDGQHADVMSELSTKLDEEIAQVMSFMGAAAGTTNAYGESLKAVDGKLSNLSGATELRSIVETLVLASREMEHNTRSLEHKLADSSRQIESLNERLDELRTEVRMDQLTGIANRRMFDEALHRELTAAAETGEELCLCVGDIDHFKRFNDTYGHQTGDQVLRLVAQAMSANVKGRDVVARYGGEEFALILPQTNLRAAVTVANQIREKVKAKELIKRSTGESLGTITISIGVARYRHGEAADELIKRSDACLYAAKRGGRDQVKCEADPDVDLVAAA
jgi:diguanylate cyclase